MEITDKQLLVLKAIVDFYISTGEPVGSKAVCADLGYRVSPATVRNYMAELMRCGLILQPHTSAGRIPSEKGFRTYVDRFVSFDKLNPDIKAYIDEKLSLCSDDPEEILSASAKIISHICAGISLVSTPICKDVRVYKIRFVQISRYTAIAILVTGSGMVKTQLFRCDFIITNEVMSIFEKLMNDCFAGVPLKDITPAFLQTTAVSLGEMGMLMSNALWTVAKLASLADKINIITSDGLSDMTSDGFPYDTANSITSFVKNKSKVESFLENSTTGVFIGSETDRDELSDSCVIVQNYYSGNNAKGILSVICPIRTNYALNIPAVRYTSQAVGKLIKDITLTEN